MGIREMQAKIRVSIHVPLAEHDCLTALPFVRITSFNSRAPRGARLQKINFWRDVLWFQFTCPSRSTTRPALPGSSSRKFQFTCPSRSTTSVYAFRCHILKFQFTCPSRSTTPLGGGGCVGQSVSIHVPLAEHDLGLCCSPCSLQVSIHVPLAEHDSPLSLRRPERTTFQFTCPSRSTTAAKLLSNLNLNVSIHVPLAEHD